MYWVTVATLASSTEALNADAVSSVTSRENSSVVAGRVGGRSVRELVGGAGGDLTGELLGIEVLEETGQLVETLGEDLVAGARPLRPVLVLPSAALATPIRPQSCVR